MTVRTRIVAAGALPPPTHGMTLVTAAMIDRLRGYHDVTVCNTGPGRFRRDFAYHGLKMLRVLRSLATLVRSRVGSPSVFYYPTDGGHGIVYGLLLIMAARLLGYRILLHHHNYSYLVGKSVLHRAAFRVAGTDAIHIVLCEAMGQALARRYPICVRRTTLGNAQFVEVSDSGRARTPGANGELVLGMIGNLTRDKGVDLAIDVFEQLRREEYPVRLVLAGPAASSKAERTVREATARHAPALVWRGRVESVEKDRFFREIDILLFPSRLPEAQPIVLLEAMAWGVPVIASGGGCIEELLGAGAGRSVTTPEQFVTTAVDAVQDFFRNRTSLDDTAGRASRRFRELCTGQAAELRRLIEGLGTRRR